MEDKNPLGEAELSKCEDNDCGTISLVKRDNCAVCDSYTNSLYFYQPKGFKTVDRGYDYSNSRHRPAKPPKPEMVFREEPSSYEKFGAGRIAFEEDNQIVLLNDNNGRLFEFEWVKYGDKISSELIVKDKLVYNRHNRKPPVENIQTVPSEYLNGALGAQYSADTLSIMIDDEVVDVGLKGVLDTQQFSAKAAIISLGQFVKMAAARELDVVPEEFSSGVQVRFSERVKQDSKFCLSDALENGSGLTRIISKPKN